MDLAHLGLHLMFSLELPMVQTWVLVFLLHISINGDCFTPLKHYFLLTYNFNIFKHILRTNSDAADLQNYLKRDFGWNSRNSYSFFIASMLQNVM